MENTYNPSEQTAQDINNIEYDKMKVYKFYFPD